MSQIPRKSGGNPQSRLVTASATITKKQPGTYITHTEQRNRIAEIQSCCGGSGGRGGALRPPSQLPQPGFNRSPQSQLPQPAPSSVSQRGPVSQLQQPGFRGAPVSSSRPPTTSNQPGLQQPRQLLQPGFSRPSSAQSGSSQRNISQLRPPQQIRTSSAPSSSRQIDSRYNTVNKTSLPQISKRNYFQTSQICKTPNQPIPTSQQQAPKMTKTKKTLTADPFPTRPFGILNNCPESCYQPPRPAFKSPSMMEKNIKSALMNKSIIKPLTKVTAKAKQITKAPPESIDTPAGVEPVLQKAVFEKRIERDQQGEALVKNLRVSKLNDQNEMDCIEMGIQQLDPQYAKMDGKEIVGVTSTISVTPSYATVSKDYVRARTEENKEIGMSPEEVAKLIEEEKEDVDNTLKMIPPELILSPGKYEMKQRLQQLRLNSESVGLLEQSIIQPKVTADEAQQESSPEAMAIVMHAVETGITPEATPDQVFNSLFKEAPTENFINLSSVTPGPLQDVVVPTVIPKEVHKEAVTNEMTKLAEKLNASRPGDIPYVDIFSKAMSDEQTPPEKGKNMVRTFEPITDERSLWVNANLEHLVNVVGAEPVDVLDPFNLEELEKTENLETEMANGMEYFLEANPVQYMNRVQLRGSQLPTYFPGYMVAVPDFPDLMKIAKSPDEVFAVAWKSVRPKYFEEESMMSLLV